MTNKYAAAIAALTIAGATGAQTNTPEQKLPRPNVLFIVVDDLGWSDVSYNGSTLVPTPNIDRIAKMGVSFTDAYVTAPISGPSRNGMVSGMYSQKYGMQINADLKAAEVPAKQMTLPETMRAAGYRTALVGKWHVCRQPEPIFDEVYQRIDISSNYFPNSTGNYDGRRLPILATADPKNENEYMTDRLANYAIKFMNKQDESQPFFYISDSMRFTIHGRHAISIMTNCLTSTMSICVYTPLFWRQWMRISEYCLTILTIAD